MEASDWYRSDAGVQCRHAIHNLWTSQILPTFSKKKTGRHQMDYARGEDSQGCQVYEALRVLIFATHLAYLFSKSSLDFWNFKVLDRFLWLEQKLSINSILMGWSEGVWCTTKCWLFMRSGHIWGCLSTNSQSTPCIYWFAHGSEMFILIDDFVDQWFQDIGGWYWATMVSRGTQGAN